MIKTQDYVPVQVSLHNIMPLLEVQRVMKAKAAIVAVQMRLSGNNTNPFELQQPNAPPNPFTPSSCDKHLSFFMTLMGLHNLSRGGFPSISLADKSGLSGVRGREE